MLAACQLLQAGVGLLKGTLAGIPKAAGTQSALQRAAGQTT